MDKTWTVYGLIDPRDASVFYVGLTSEIKSRVRAHSSDPTSAAWHVCQVIEASGLTVGHCVFGNFLEKLPAKILEGRLILSMRQVLVNKISFHGLPSSTLYPNWQDVTNASLKQEPKLKFDRKAYQRELMRKRRMANNNGIG